MSSLDYQRYYRRNLPHIQPPGATLFLTFRLAGSLPRNVVSQWNREREWLEHLVQKNSSQYDQVKRVFERVWFQKFESILDGSSVGPLWLKDGRVASQVAESLHYRDEKVYRLHAFTIMPNHVHAVIKPLPVVQDEGIHQHRAGVTDHSQTDVEYHSLASIMQSLKGYTAYKGQSDTWT